MDKPKPERTHVYVATCPDCDAVLQMTSVVKGDDPAFVAMEVAKAIMRGLVVEVMTDLDFRDKRPGMGECSCRARMMSTRPSCAYCAGVIYKDGVIFENYVFGSIAIIHLHKDCYQKMQDEFDYQFIEFGGGERPDSPEKEADAARGAREMMIARGQMELPL